jgi:hypothetical protein
VTLDSFILASQNIENINQALPALVWEAPAVEISSVREEMREKCLWKKARSLLQLCIIQTGWSQRGDPHLPVPFGMPSLLPHLNSIHFKVLLILP